MGEVKTQETEKRGYNVTDLPSRVFGFQNAPGAQPSCVREQKTANGDFETFLSAAQTQKTRKKATRRRALRNAPQRIRATKTETHRRLQEAATLFLAFPFASSLMPKERNTPRVPYQDSMHTAAILICFLPFFSRLLHASREEAPHRRAFLLLGVHALGSFVSSDSFSATRRRFIMELNCA